MSNLEDFQNVYGVASNSDKALGATMGVLADIGGVISLVGFAVSVVEWIDGVNSDDDAYIQQFEQELQQIFQQLQAQAAGSAVQQQQVQIDNQFGAIQAAWTAVSGDPQLYQQNPAAAAQSWQAALAAIDAMSQADGYWNLGYSDWPFWNDVGDHTYLGITKGITPTLIDSGYGQIEPPLNGANEAMNYSLILPRYLQALVNMFGIAYILGPTQLQEWLTTVSQTVIPLLQGVLATVISNIRVLQPAVYNWTGVTLSDWTVQHDGNSTVVTGWSPVGPATSLYGTILQAYSGVNIEYGAVEVFSGYSSIGNYQLMFSDAFQRGSTDLSAYHKFQLRLLARRYQTATVTMRRVWTAINELKTLTGAAPEAAMADGAWSLRFLTQIAVPVSGGPTSLKTLRNFIRSTPPFDVSPAETSFQVLLTPTDGVLIGTLAPPATARRLLPKPPLAG